jgi:hypothetical protein
MPDETQDAPAMTETPDPVAAESPSLPQIDESLIPQTPPEGEKTEEQPHISEEEQKAQELLDWAAKKYEGFAELSPQQQRDFLAQRAIDSNKEGRRLARRVKELEHALSSVTERRSEEEDEDVDIPDVAPPPNLARLEAQSAKLVERQKAVVSRLQGLATEIEEARAATIYAKAEFDLTDDSEPGLKKIARDRWTAQAAQFKAQTARYDEMADKYEELGMRLQESQEQLENARQQHNSIREQQRAKEIANRKYIATQDRIFTETAEKLVFDNDLDDSVVEELRDKVSFELHKRMRRGDEPIDMAKYVTELFNREYKPGGKAKPKPSASVRPVVPAMPSVAMPSPQPSSQQPHVFHSRADRLQYESEQAEAKQLEMAKRLGWI